MIHWYNKSNTLAQFEYMWIILMCECERQGDKQGRFFLNQKYNYVASWHQLQFMNNYKLKWHVKRRILFNQMVFSERSNNFDANGTKKLKKGHWQ